jgi:hypothetical protein
MFHGGLKDIKEAGMCRAIYFKTIDGIFSSILPYIKEYYGSLCRHMSECGAEEGRCREEVSRGSG